MTNAGRVGIGTTNPQTALQVSGPANTATNRATPYANAFASVTNDIFYGTTGQVGLEIGSGTRASGDNDRVYKYVLNTINNATVGAGVDFQILGIPTAAGSYTSDGTARNRVTIRYDGNVGIGTANPATALQIGGTGVTGNVLQLGNFTFQMVSYQGLFGAGTVTYTPSNHGIFVAFFASDTMVFTSSGTSSGQYSAVTTYLNSASLTGNTGLGQLSLSTAVNGVLTATFKNTGDFMRVFRMAF
jgi:hypothetical protein